MNRFLFMLIAVLLLISACTLGTAQDVRGINLDATQTALPLVTATDPLALAAQGTGAVPATPVLQSNQTAANCGRLRVNVGTAAGATLRLREQPNNSSTVILLIPNDTLVDRVTGSQDISAGGYTWVNIRYTDPNGVIATGWAARDAMKNQITLREEGC